VQIGLAELETLLFRVMQVVAGAEVTAAAPDDDGAHFVIAARLFQIIDHVDDHRRNHRIALFRAIHRDGRDTVFLFVQNQIVFR